VGKIYDDRGHRMSPSHSRKEAGSISRVPAAEIEQVVADAVRQELGTDSELPTRDLIEGHVTRVEVHTAKISVELRKPVPNQRPSKFLGESLRSSDAASSSHPHQGITRTRVRSAPTHVPVSLLRCRAAGGGSTSCFAAASRASRRSLTARAAARERITRWEHEHILEAVLINLAYGAVGEPSVLCPVTLKPCSVNHFFTASTSAAFGAYFLLSSLAGVN
jgi:hypothetical protein